jgi:hypothetical protein
VLPLPHTHTHTHTIANIRLGFKWSSWYKMLWLVWIRCKEWIKSFITLTPEANNYTLFTVVIYKSRVFVTGRVFQLSIIFVPANFRPGLNWLIVANRLSYYNRKSFKIKISRVSFLLGSLEQVFYFKLGCFVTSVILLYAQVRAETWPRFRPVSQRLSMV